MKIFLTGGSGFAGAVIAKRLLADGHQVTALARSSGSRQKVEALGATSFEGDLAEPKSLEPGLNGHDCVVHCAAHFALHGSAQLFEQINVEGTRALLGAARRSGVKRFLYISAAGVVMDDLGTSMNSIKEDAPTNTGSNFPYIASKARAEQLVIDANSADFSTLALRPPGIWGPGDAYSRMLPTAARRLSFAWIEGGRAECSVCHVENLAEAVVCALGSPASGRALFVSDDQPLKVRDFFTSLADRLSIRLERFPSVPYGLASFFGTLIEGLWSFTRLPGDPPLTSTMVRLIGRDFTIDDSAARDLLGYRSLVDLESGLRSYP